MGRGGGMRQQGGSAVLVAATSAELVTVKLFAASPLVGSGSAHTISGDVWARRWPDIEGGRRWEEEGDAAASWIRRAPLPLAELVVAMSIAGGK
uniref:Uncharacterized protein n=2 Tax=Oryza TaxID=4527 RepID=A0A0E0IS92_ORYNI